MVSLLPKPRSCTWTFIPRKYQGTPMQFMFAIALMSTRNISFKIHLQQLNIMRHKNSTAMLAKPWTNIAPLALVNKVGFMSLWPWCHLAENKKCDAQYQTTFSLYVVYTTQEKRRKKTGETGTWHDLQHLCKKLAKTLKSIIGFQNLVVSKRGRFSCLRRLKQAIGYCWMTILTEIIRNRETKRLVS